MPGPSLLEVDNLNIDLNGRRVLSEVSFSVDAGQIVGLFGESGCGKTTTAMALLKLLPADRYRVQGSVRLAGRELLALRESELERVRGAQISMIFQDPLLALNPVMRISDQVREVLRAHHKVRDANELFDLVGIPLARREAYPHQLSGGERQRVLLAQALAAGPGIVIADEPFTALDASLAGQMAELFRELTRKLGTSFLLITHSPGVLARIANRVLAMYAGGIVERGRPAELLHTPLHPYTAGLLRCMRPAANGRLYSIPGNPPALSDRVEGCPFEPRCEDRMAICRTAMPGEETRGAGRSARCFKYAC